MLCVSLFVFPTPRVVLFLIFSCMPLFVLSYLSMNDTQALRIGEKKSFNNWILEARYLPCISMLEWIRQKNMVRIQENRTKSEKWEGTICPNVFKKLKQNIKRSGNCDVLWNGKEGFEVLEHEKFKFTVNLEAWTCSCRYWQLSGMPCCHAISAIYKTGRKIDDYIAKCYTIDKYKKIYFHY